MTSRRLNTYCDIVQCMNGLWIFITKHESPKPKGDSYTWSAPTRNNGACVIMSLLHLQVSQHLAVLCHQQAQCWMKNYVYLIPILLCYQFFLITCLNYDFQNGRRYLKKSCGTSSVNLPDSKVDGANKGPTWVLSAPDGPHVGPMNLVIRATILIHHHMLM